MSEVISTTFSANSSEFVAEVKKARTAVDDLAGKVLPNLEKKMQAAQAQALNTSKGMREVQKAGTNTGANMLQLSYFVDDLQYGFRGIANNIPNMVQGFGGSMGLAGAISIVSIAAATAIPLLKKLYSSADTAAAVAAAKEYGSVLKQNLATIEAQAKALEFQRQLQNSVGATQSFVDRETNASPVIANIQNEIAALREKAMMEDRLFEAQKNREMAIAQAAGEDPAKVADQFDKAAEARNNARLESERKLQKQLADLQTEEINRMQIAASSSMQFFDQTLLGMESEIARLQRNAAFSKASLEQAKKEAEDPDLSSKELKNAQQNLEMAKKRAEFDKQQLENQKAAYQQTLENKNLAQAEFQEAMKKASQQSTEAARRAMALEAEKKLAQDIAKINEEERRANATIRENQEAEKNANKSSREANKAARLADEEKRRKTALADTQAELMILKAQAAGQKTLATEMQKRLAIVKEARDIAAQTGLSEKEALALAIQKAKLEEQVKKNEKKPKTPRDGRIRLFRAGEAPGTLQRGAAGTMLRSEAFTRRTQSWMNKTPKVKTDNSISEEQLKVQQQLLKFFTSQLGAV